MSHLQAICPVNHPSLSPSLPLEGRTLADIELKFNWLQVQRVAVNGCLMTRGESTITRVRASFCAANWFEEHKLQLDLGSSLTVCTSATHRRTKRNAKNVRILREERRGRRMFTCDAAWLTRCGRSKIRTLIVITRTATSNWLSGVGTSQLFAASLSPRYCVCTPMRRQSQQRIPASQKVHRFRNQIGSTRLEDPTII